MKKYRCKPVLFCAYWGNLVFRVVSIVGEGLDPPLTYRCRNRYYVAITQHIMNIIAICNISRLGRVKTLPYFIDQSIGSVTENSTQVSSL